MAWQTQTFKTREAMAAWLERNAHLIQWEEIFIENGYAVEYRLLRIMA